MFFYLQYDLAELKQFCEEFLCVKLMNDSVIDMLVLADMHNASILKAKAMLFIKRYYLSFKFPQIKLIYIFFIYFKRNASQILNTDKWKTFVTNQKQLFEEVHSALCQLKDEGANPGKWSIWSEPHILICKMYLLF